MRHALLALAIALGVASHAAAQNKVGGWIDVNFLSTLPQQESQTYSTAGLSTSGSPVGLGATIPELSNAIGFGVEGGVTFGRGIGVGARIEQAQWDYTAGLGLVASHPVFFDLIAIDADETADELRRTDRAIDIMGSWAIPVSKVVTIRVFGGPTFYQVEQEMVSNITFSRTFNIIGTINQVNITDFDQRTADGSGIGFNVGGDVAFFFSRHVGVGAGIRYNQGEAEITDPLSGDDVDLDMSRFTFSTGLRLRF